MLLNREPAGKWRSLAGSRTGERHTFASLEQLFAFLSERCERQVPHTPEAPGT
jgi:hypothetical protein